MSNLGYMCDSLQEVAEKSELIVIAHNNPHYFDILSHLQAKHLVLDFYNLFKDEHVKQGTIINPWFLSPGA